MSILSQNGYCHMERVGSFNLFEDTSTMIYNGYHISLNIAAKKCIGDNDSYDDLIDIGHNAEPFDRSLAY